MLNSKRKSAFSVYAENKPPEVEEKKINKKQNGNQEFISHKFNKNKNVQFDDYVSLKSNGRHNGIQKKNNNRKIKREKKKFAKLDNQILSQSIDMFNANSTPFKFVQNHNATQQVVLKENNKSQNKQKHANNNNKKNLSEQKLKIKKNEIASAKAKQKSNVSLPFINESRNSLSDKFAQDADDYESNEYKIDLEMFDSRQEATKLFRKIISPVKANEFFSKYWEKEALLIKRHENTYFKSWFSCKEFDFILRNHNLEFTTNIDVVTYIDGVKQKHNPEGKAYAPIVWDFFQQGCSIRLLNPATYSKNVWKYLSLLQELFGTCVGANVYLTPAGTQGFAPHYDDIEAFVLQLEGKKRWRVYKPLSPEETLPRYSSQNFEQNILREPIIDVILEPGDLLYFPRGYVHQANALDDIHSLHITVSCYQLNTWGDFLTKLIPGAIEIAIQEDVEFRKGLPINYLMNNGVAFNDNQTKDRTEFANKTGNLIKKLIKYLPIDAAVDQMGKQFIHESLPPCFTNSEKSRSIHGHGEHWNEEKNRVDNISEIEPDTAIKLVRKNCIRLVVENDSCLVYHNLDNSKIWKEKEPQFLEVESDAAPAIEFLLKSYPNFVTVDELPMETIEEKITVASCLYDKGLLVTGEPLQSIFDSNEDEDDDEQDEEDENENGKMSDEDEDDENEELVGYDEEDDENQNDDDFNSVDYDKNASDNENQESNEDEEGDEEEHEEEEEEEDEDDQE